MSAIVEQFSAVLWNVINRPSIVDVIDVLLLTVIIYEMLVHMRHTRISQTIKGIVILLLATWVSDMIGMRTIHALLSWVINAGPVLLIVLFQPEIRRILEELGTNAILEGGVRMQPISNTDLMIDELVLALGNMSRRRVGALIVIENKTRLTDVIATGTKVDGMVSQPLIENIFEPNTPLHDGAVVVRGERIMSAACLLHLSDTTGVGRDLGTRHRAGLGMSEVSDATVFIVSEETGIISMARGGQLTRHLDEDSLRRILHELYDRTEKESGRLQLNVPKLQLPNLRQRRKAAHDEPQTDKEE
ncbi:MAG: diadenylate cyclase CdaA [Clostridia bacterium]|nr:diadenylate cyclase CdaA [Clostridia bacterium]